MYIRTQNTFELSEKQSKNKNRVCLRESNLNVWEARVKARGRDSSWIFFFFLSVWLYISSMVNAHVRDIIGCNLICCLETCVYRRFAVQFAHENYNHRLIHIAHEYHYKNRLYEYVVDCYFMDMLLTASHTHRFFFFISLFRSLGRFHSSTTKWVQRTEANGFGTLTIYRAAAAAAAHQLFWKRTILYSLHISFRCILHI